MAAVLGVLNESLTESIKGFYKLRKAFITLDTIIAAEASYMRSRDGLGTGTPKKSLDSLGSSESVKSMSRIPGAFDGGTASQGSSRPTSIHSLEAPGLNMDGVRKGQVQPKTSADGKSDDEEDEFYDADEEPAQNETTTYNGHIETNGVTSDLAGLSLKHEDIAPLAKEMPPPQAPTSVKHGLLDHDPDSEIFANPIDVFIHSGANLCFGILLVMISMIPPAFGKLLFIIGFHGDKTRGLRMLWQASKFHNINGAMAGLMLLGYYNTLIGFSDIIPDTDPTIMGDDQVEGYPKERCEALLADMRSRYPKSQIWLLEESRMLASVGDFLSLLLPLRTSECLSRLLCKFFVGHFSLLVFLP